MVLHSAGESVIYPAHAGINLTESITFDNIKDLPRTRGDKPELRGAVFDLIPSTPHTRG